MKRIVAGLVLALVVLGCASWRLGDPVPLLAGIPANVGDSSGCFTSAIEGQLVVDPTYGTAIVTSTRPEGRAIIAWRPGFSARRIGSEVAVLDTAGNMVATTGNKYRIAGGGVTWPEPSINVFWACDFVTQV
jgi:hypothetical protein